jgi:hypothetical protein
MITADGFPRVMIISGENGFALALGLLFIETSQIPDYITRLKKRSPAGDLQKIQPSVSEGIG